MKKINVHSECQTSFRNTFVIEFNHYFEFLRVHAKVRTVHKVNAISINDKAESLAMLASSNLERERQSLLSDSSRH
jgi:ABC-type uncharacterized transport system substrate-binding protein